MALRTDRLTVAYGQDGPVLRDVSAEVRAGQVLAVTGPSGAGKTTLLRAMAGRIAPLSGSVTATCSPGEIVLVPQDSGLAAILTASENIQVALIANRVAAADARRRTAQALERVGLAGQASQLVEELSGGQQQRTAIARGLALQATVLLCDEVTSELDAANRQRILELLFAEAGRGAAVVFATHDADAAKECDSELHLLDGSVSRP